MLEMGASTAWMDWLVTYIVDVGERKRGQRSVVSHREGVCSCFGNPTTVAFTANGKVKAQGSRSKGVWLCYRTRLLGSKTDTADNWAAWGIRNVTHCVLEQSLECWRKLEWADRLWLVLVWRC